MAFWSVLLPGKGKEVVQEVESTETVLSSIHLTGLALGPTPSKGPHVVTVEYNGTNTVIATLEAPHTRQCRLDIALDQTFKFRATGDSEVHAYGYQVATHNHIDDMDEDEDEDEDEYEGEDEEDEDEEEDEEAPKAVPLLRGKKVLAASPRSDAMDEDAEDEDEDEDEEGEGGEDEDEEEGSDMPSFAELGSDDIIAEGADDEDEGEEGEEEEDEEEEAEEEEAKPTPRAGSKRQQAQTPQPAKATKQSRQEPPKSAPPKQQAAAAAAAKPSKGPKQIPVTLVGAEGAKEKGKAGKGGKEAPAASTPTVKSPAAPSNEKEFHKALVDLIKGQKGGPVPLSQLGSAIKKPASVPLKLGAYLAQHSNVFEVDAKKGVSLAKKK